MGARGPKAGTKSARTLLDELRAQKVERQLEEFQNTLVEVEPCRRLMREFNADFRQRLLAVPARAVDDPRFAGVDPKFFTEVSRELNEAMDHHETVIEEVFSKVIEQSRKRAGREVLTSRGEFGTRSNT